MDLVPIKFRRLQRIAAPENTGHAAKMRKVCTPRGKPGIIARLIERKAEATMVVLPDHESLRTSSDFTEGMAATNPALFR